MHVIRSTEMRRFKRDFLRERGFAKGSYYESPPQSIIFKRQGNEEIIQKSSQSNGEKEPDWEPLSINKFLHTDLHELQSILNTIYMDLEPT